MTLYTWSQTANTNASADPTVNWSEGQPPSSVNDSARAMMAATAKWRDDISGANLATTGTSTVYAVTSNQGFDTVPHMVAQTLTIYPHTTNGVNPTLNVDLLGAFPIVTDAAGTPVPAGAMIAGTPYELALDGTNHWRLKNFYVKPYEMPIGTILDFIGTSAPNSSFALAFGQAISRTTYAALFALIGTTFGVGDGTTTFNLPDLRGRVTAGKGDMGGADVNLLNATYFGASGTTLGAIGGAQQHSVAQANLPNVNFVNSGIAVNAALTYSYGYNGQTSTTPAQIVFATNNTGGSVVTDNSTGSGVPLTIHTSVSTQGVAASGGSGTPLATVQPTMIVNKIIRII